LTDRLLPAKNEKMPTKGEHSFAAVMILLVKKEEQWNILYTHRTNEVKTHQGEVSFPGGVYENQDRSMLDTALRETKEEIGIDADSIRILGSLSEFNSIHGLKVYPFVGILESTVNFMINKSEVEKIFFIPIDWLKNPKNHYEQPYQVSENIIRNVLHFKDFDHEPLWGLTARITLDLLQYL